MPEEMSEVAKGQANPSSPLELAVQSLQSRIEHLEAPQKKTIIKRLSENASIAALLLGLALTIAQVRETFLSKPETDRVAQLSALNQSVGAIARLRQEYAEVDRATADNRQRLILESILTTRIANERTTALALLRDVRNQDVGIPQLTVLYNEAVTNGDSQSADLLTTRAIEIKEVTDYEHSEALRQRGQYLFSAGRPDEGRIAFEQAINAFRPIPATAAARSYDLMNLMLVELVAGDCERVPDEVRRFGMLLTQSQATPEQRGSMIDTLRLQYDNSRSQRCTNLTPLSTLPG